MQTKQSPLVSAHHLHGTNTRLVARKFGVIQQDIVRHRIGIRFDDAGNDKEQRPQEHENAVDQIQQKQNH
jgi:phage-related protein